MNQARLQEVGELRPQLVKFAMLRLRDRVVAEDAVQETLLAALEGIDRYAGDASLRTWLTGILKHKIADCLRGTGREVPFEPDEESTQDRDSDPESALVRKRFVACVASGLENLPANAAHVFVQRELVGSDTHEICRQLAISRANCWVLLHRAKTRLRQCAGIDLLLAETA